MSHIFTQLECGLTKVQSLNPEPKIFIFSEVLSFFPFNLFFYCRIIALQNFAAFCQTSTLSYPLCTLPVFTETQLPLPSTEE